MADRRADPIAATNTPETAEPAGRVATGEAPPIEGPENWGPSQTDTREADKPEGTEPGNIPGYPDDLGVAGGFPHGTHRFVITTAMDPTTQVPVQRTLCVECGGELVGK